MCFGMSSERVLYMCCVNIVQVYSLFYIHIFCEYKAERNATLQYVPKYKYLIEYNCKGNE